MVFIAQVPAAGGADHRPTGGLYRRELPPRTLHEEPRIAGLSSRDAREAMEA
jgi:hypothetical protein